MKFTSTVVLCITLLNISFHARGQVATFENFTEGPVSCIGCSFVDPLSGITFSNAVNNAGSTAFDIENAGIPPTVPPLVPGNYLELGGYAPGPGAGFGAGSKFTFTLPVPSTLIELDVFYFAIALLGDISFSAYSDTGQLLFTLNEPVSTLQQTSLLHPVLTSATPIRSVFVSAPELAGTLFDNIAIPEPSCIALLIIGSLSLWANRRRLGFD